MSTGQFLYILFAVVIFTTFAVTINQQRQSSTEQVVGHQYDQQAIALAQAIIEEAWVLAFDDRTWAMGNTGNNKLDVPDDFTAPGSMGPEGNEKYGSFNDLDDFHNLDEDIVFGDQTYHVEARVWYVDPEESDFIVNRRTAMKLLSITVTSDEHPEMEITQEMVYSYY